MTDEQAKRDERLRVVLGLSAAGITYDDMKRYVGVGTRQRVQQLVVRAVAKLPKLAERLGVSGRRHAGRRRKLEPEVSVRCKVADTMEASPHASVRARHLVTARTLLNENGGRYPGAAEMLKAGHGALYQFMRKYPAVFERLKREWSAGAGQGRIKRRRRRRF